MSASQASQQQVTESAGSLFALEVLHRSGMQFYEVILQACVLTQTTRQSL